MLDEGHKELAFALEVMVDGIVNNEVGPLALVSDGKWEETVSFIPLRVGDNQKVELLLYRGGESVPYLQPLHLWVDVKERR